MNSTGKLQIGGTTYDFTSDDLHDLGEIGMYNQCYFFNVLNY